MASAADYSHFREHRTGDELNRLLHYGHIIPVSKGYTAKYVADHYPGWTWNQLVAVFVAAGIFVNRGGTPPKCDDRVEVFHFTDANTFAVEWRGGVQPKKTRLRPADGQYVFEAAPGTFVYSLGGVEPEA